jgi:prefoldin subunit 5
MSEYCRVNNEQFSRINQELKDMNKKILELDQCNVHIEKLKISTDHKIKDLTHTLGIGAYI